MSVDTIRPAAPIQVITPADVRASIGRARRSLEKAAEEIVWQIEMEAWRTLGYPSWSAMREAEYGGAAFMVPSKNKPELIARIRAAGLTQRETADTMGISQQTVSNHDEPRQAHPSRSTNFGTSEKPDDDVIDAEVIEDDEPVHVNRETGEVLDTQKATDPAPAEPVIATTCPTCHGTGKVTR